eukprot:COSAG01_NODE_2791_length_7069_cov_11.407174_1_plen_158_part_10
MRVSQEGYFPYARLLFEAHQAMRSTKPRMVNRGVKADLVGADPEAYKAGEEVSRRELSVALRIDCWRPPPPAAAAGSSPDRSSIQSLTRVLLICMRFTSQLMWWSFSSTTTEISALSNPMFLGKVSDTHTHTPNSLSLSLSGALLSPGIGCVTTVVLR